MALILEFLKKENSRRISKDDKNNTLQSALFSDLQMKKKLTNRGGKGVPK